MQPIPKRVPWPDGTQMPVVLMFDMDAESLFISVDPELVPKKPVVISQGEYGPRVGVPRILRLLDEYDIKASFYIPGVCVEKYPDTVEAILAKGHEISHHMYTHKRNDEMTPDEEEEGIAKALDILEKATGERPRGWKSTAWEYSPVTLRLVRKYGFAYDCSAMGNDIPYYIPVDGRPTDLVEIPIHWILDDAPFFWFNVQPLVNFGSPMAQPSKVLEIWSEEFEGLYHEGALYSLTMHPFIIGRPHRMRMLEKLIKTMREKPGVRFMRARDVVELYKKLVPPPRG
ncbi:MAG TPA: polysaccharide deacetylase [Candidatus Sulfotelmatobacter sp.]|nr:polysaccharide deacetylase [Candidatus Sulfotelmatobacter sp.]